MIDVSFPKKLVKGKRVFTLEKELPCGKIAENECYFHEFKKVYEISTGIKLTDEEFQSTIMFVITGVANPLLYNAANSCATCGLCK